MKAMVVKGKGEGARYVDVYSDRIRKEVGFTPYPGTLNLKVDNIPPLETLRIDGFGRFGAIELASCAVNGERAFAVFPEKGERKEGIVEIIAEKNLRALLGLEEGDFVDIQF